MMLPIDRIVRRATAEDYEGVDLEQAQRMGSLLELVGVLAGAVLLTVAPPTAAFGRAGWLLAVVLVLLGLVGFASARFTQSYAVGLGMAYAGVVQVALLEWLGGGLASPYHLLYVLPLVYVAGVHPAPRLTAFLAVLAAASALPLVYGVAGAHEAGIVMGLVLLWAGLGVVIHQLMHRVRVGRLRLTREGAEARRLARLDSLTGLGNRRAFEEALEREVSRSHRTHSPLTVVVADLDGFKEINDRYGHAAGDQCLRAAAEALDDAVRLPDVCFRWGGDEFAVLLPDTDLEAATLVGERLTGAVEGACSAPGGGGVSVSLGTAELAAGTTPQQLVDLADRRLLESKRGPSERDPD